MNQVAEKRAFYTGVFWLMLPVVGQNLVNLGVQMADIVMLAYVNQTALSAASLANNISFILSLVFFGIASGATILASQYWGKGDTATVERVLGLSLRFSVSIALVFAVAAWFFPQTLMSIYTADAALIATGAAYLRILAVSYLCMSVTTMYLNIMRSMERVLLSTVVYAVSLLVNVTLNAVFIFGLLGAPKLGIVGVAIGTVAARAVEVAICLGDSMRNKLVRIRLASLWERNPALLRDFFRYALPALANDIVWGVGFSMYSVIMGRLGSDVVAANAIAQVVRNMATVVCMGVSTCTSILVGKSLGENRLEEAKVYAARLLRLAMITGALGGVLILLLKPVIVSYPQIEDQARRYLEIMAYISAYSVFGQAVNTTLICGIFRAGGDSKFGLFCDVITMWLFSVPLGFLCAFVFNLPVMWVYFIIFLDEFIKMPFVFWRYRQKKWLRNITRDEVRSGVCAEASS